MQQMQYHGIASYKFEYQLSTGGDWTTAVDTTASTDNSYEYTYGSLTGGKSYNLRVTVTDRAGNSSTGTNTGTTKIPEKNPGGVIGNITTDEKHFSIPTTGRYSSNLGKIVIYEPFQKSVTVPASITGAPTDQVYSSTSNLTWYVVAETSDALYVSTLRTKVNFER